MLALVFALLLGAQTVTTDELQRVQDTVNEVSDDISQLRRGDSALAGQLERQLDQVRDDVAYLRVKQRRNETIDRREYADVRDRLEDIRVRARGETVHGAVVPDDTRAATRPGATSADEIRVGTEFDVRLQSSLTSDTARVEDRFTATTAADIRNDDRVVVPAGSVLFGTVSSVTRAGRIERKGSLTLAFDRIVIDGRTYDIRATVVQALESEGLKGEAPRVGVGAAAGGIIGALLGGVKGALAGVLIGGGGTLAATEGKDVHLPAGTVLRVRLDTPLDLSRQSFN
jgi:hypothetical protein